MNTEFGSFTASVVDAGGGVVKLQFAKESKKEASFDESLAALGLSTLSDDTVYVRVGTGSIQAKTLAEWKDSGESGGNIVAGSFTMAVDVIHTGKTYEQHAEATANGMLTLLRTMGLEPPDNKRLKTYSPTVQGLQIGCVLDNMKELDARVESVLSKRWMAAFTEVSLLKWHLLQPTAKALLNKPNVAEFMEMTDLTMLFKNFDEILKETGVGIGDSNIDVRSIYMQQARAILLPDAKVIDTFFDASHVPPGITFDTAAGVALVDDAAVRDWLLNEVDKWFASSSSRSQGHRVPYVLFARLLDGFLSVPGVVGTKDAKSGLSRVHWAYWMLYNKVSLDTSAYSDYVDQVENIVDLKAIFPILAGTDSMKKVDFFERFIEKVLGVECCENLIHSIQDGVLQFMRPTDGNSYDVLGRCDTRSWTQNHPGAIMYLQVVSKAGARFTIALGMHESTFGRVSIVEVDGLVLDHNTWTRNTHWTLARAWSIINKADQLASDPLVTIEEARMETKVTVTVKESLTGYEVLNVGLRSDDGRSEGAPSDVLLFTARHGAAVASCKLHLASGQLEVLTPVQMTFSGDNAIADFLAWFKSPSPVGQMLTGAGLAVGTWVGDHQADFSVDIGGRLVGGWTLAHDEASDTYELRHASGFKTGYWNAEAMAERLGMFERMAAEITSLGLPQGKSGGSQDAGDGWVVSGGDDAVVVSADGKVSVRMDFRFQSEIRVVSGDGMVLSWNVNEPGGKAANIVLARMVKDAILENVRSSLNGVELHLVLGQGDSLSINNGKASIKGYIYHSRSQIVATNVQMEVDTNGITSFSTDIGTATVVGSDVLVFSAGAGTQVATMNWRNPGQFFDLVTQCGVPHRVGAGPVQFSKASNKFRVVGSVRNLQHQASATSPGKLSFEFTRFKDTSPTPAWYSAEYVPNAAGYVVLNVDGLAWYSLRWHEMQFLGGHSRHGDEDPRFWKVGPKGRVYITFTIPVNKVETCPFDLLTFIVPRGQHFLPVPSR